MCIAVLVCMVYILKRKRKKRKFKKIYLHLPLGYLLSRITIL